MTSTDLEYSLCARYKTLFIHTYQGITANHHNVNTKVTKRKPCCISPSIQEDNILLRLTLLLSARDWVRRNRCWQWQWRTSRKQPRDRATEREWQQRIEPDTEKESLAWIRTVSGLESRGYLCLSYKFACSWLQHAKPGSRDTCPMEKSAEKLQEIFTINFVRHSQRN